MFVNTLNSKYISQSSLMSQRDVGTKCDRALIEIDFLARGALIISEDILQNSALRLFGFDEDKGIFDEEKMADAWGLSTDFHTIS